jgi:hypothetical protein
MSKGKSDRLQIEYRSPHDLRPRADNAVLHSKRQIRKIAKSMRRFGCVNPILTSDDGEIVAGHVRVAAAKLLGLPLIPTIRLSSLTPSERLAYNLADNQLGKFGRYDRDLLAVQLEELTSLGFDDIEVTGFSLGDIKIRLEEAAQKNASPVGPCEELPTPRKFAVTRKDDDAAATADCETLMREQPADLVLTDGPWKLSYFSGPLDFSKTRSEKSEAEIIAFLSSFLRLAKASAKPGTIMVVFTGWRLQAQQMPLKDLFVGAKRLGLSVAIASRTQSPNVSLNENNNGAQITASKP